MFAFLLGLSLSWNAMATDWRAEHEAIWDVHNQKFISLEDMQANAGDILVLGEDHATTDNDKIPETFIHHDNQVRLIQQLQDLGKQSGFSVSVGMEFLTYTMQDLVDQFLAGSLTEADFLTQEGWDSGNPFQFYSRQILAPAHTQGKTIALNIPLSIANQVAEGGNTSLSPTQQALTPPFWELGNDAYFARFQAAMAGHASVTDINKFFWAQCLWDDTMAWNALKYRSQTPNDVMVIIVGEFHVQYGGGLPYEMKKNSSAVVKTILQIETTDWQSATLKKAVLPDATYGEQADFLWLHTGKVSVPVAPLIF